MERKTFNMAASLAAFILGAVYIFSDKASITANVIGASGTGAGTTAIFGMAMIMGAIGLFIVSMHSTDNHTVDLERLIRGSKHHSEMRSETSENTNKGDEGKD